MSEVKPFISLDKPISWVVGVCAGLVGLAVGLVGFVFAWLDFKIIQAIAIGLFIICWITFSLSWLFFVARLVSGRYSNLRSKPWREQIW
jgi:hypothetical protein